MKNAIKYYYNLNADNIHQMNKIYKFTISEKKYILYPYTRSTEEINDIYKLQIYLSTIGIKCHQIIINTNNQILTSINGLQYVLLNMIIENRKISIEDIIYLTNININNDIKKIQKHNWNELWSNKIDYIEYQINQFGKKYPLIRESSDYYIGLAENCISLLIGMNTINKLSISHERITKNTTTEDFFNPINFIIDNRVRDIAEYLKTIMIEENAMDCLKQYLYYSRLDNNENILLFARLLYPSTYFDIYEQIINGKEQEKSLKKYIEKNEEYERGIKKIYNYLRSIFNLPEIEWLLPSKY